MKKILVFGLLVGVISVFAAKAEFVETTEGQEIVVESVESGDVAPDDEMVVEEVAEEPAEEPAVEEEVAESAPVEEEVFEEDSEEVVSE